MNSGIARLNNEFRSSIEDMVKKPGIQISAAAILTMKESTIFGVSSVFTRVAVTFYVCPG
ncbi:MAG: hypothetical protein WCF90_08095 [Methanomicrobiales archaeon]